MKMNWFGWLTWVLVIVGALNWGLVGFFDWNLVEAIFGAWPIIVTIIYAAVGLSALWMIYQAFK